MSVGIALTEPGKTADDVLRDADVAMYEAKTRGGGGVYKVFDQASMGTRSSERLQIEADLRNMYMLGFTPPASARDGQFHKLEVSVARPDVVVRTRAGYWALQPNNANEPPR